MENDPVELFDALAATERNGGEVDDGEIQGAAKELGGEAGVVMKKVSTRLNREGEGGQRGEEAAIVKVDEHVGGDGEVVCADGRDLGGDVGGEATTLCLAEEGKDFGANVDAIEAGSGADEGEKAFELGLGEGCVVGEIFPAGEIEARTDQKGAARRGLQVGPGGVECGGVGGGGIATQSPALIQCVDRFLFLGFLQAGVEEGEGVAVTGREGPVGWELAIQLDQQRMAGVADLRDRHLEGIKSRFDGGVRSEDAKAGERQRL